MRPFEVVFNEPFGEFPVENLRIGAEIAQIHEFFLERTVEPLVVWIVFRRSDSRIVLLDPESRASSFEILFKLGAVVMTHPGDVFVEEKMQSQKEIFAVLGTLVSVHPGKSRFAVFVDRGENISFDAVAVNDNRIEADDVSGFFSVPRELVQIKFGDPLFFLRSMSF